MTTYALFTSKKQYRKFCKKNEMEAQEESFGFDACVASYEKDGHVFCAVIAVNYKRFDRNGLCGLLVHEGAHVWQEFRESIRESAPSSEFEAYTLQEIFLNLINEFDRQTA